MYVAIFTNKSDIDFNVLIGDLVISVPSTPTSCNRDIKDHNNVSSATTRHSTAPSDVKDEKKPLEASKSLPASTIKETNIGGEQQPSTTVSTSSPNTPPSTFSLPLINNKHVNNNANTANHNAEVSNEVTRTLHTAQTIEIPTENTTPLVPTATMLGAARMLATGSASNASQSKAIQQLQQIPEDTHGMSASETPEKADDKKV